MIFRKVKKLHFIGIGGIGMSGMAELLHNLGFEITGSDMSVSERVEYLRSLGIEIFKGHFDENVNQSDVVVYSSAVQQDNPEIQAARERKIPIIRRAEMLGEIMKVKRFSVGVAGTHGKTTTTSMIGQVLTEASFDPTLIIGGIVRSFSSNARLGEGDWIVVEADEYDRTFLMLSPTYAIVTTLELEHTDCYTSLEDIQGAFQQFCNSVPFYGKVIVCLDEPSIQEILPGIKKPIITYGFASQADVRAENVSYSETDSKYTLLCDGKPMGDIRIHVPGEHNVKNSLAAVALGLELNIPFEVIRKGLSSFSGVRRRFEIKCLKNNIMVVDDYAHHPTEIKATLAAARNGWKRRRIVIFQPHLYSRTRDFAEDFGKALLDSDLLYVVDVYPAREEPIPGVSGELVANAARNYGHKNVRFEKDLDKVTSDVLNESEPGDMIITMGAGMIWQIADRIAESLPDD